MKWSEVKQTLYVITCMSSYYAGIMLFIDNQRIHVLRSLVYGIFVYDSHDAEYHIEILRTMTTYRSFEKAVQQVNGDKDKVYENQSIDGISI